MQELSHAITATTLSMQISAAVFHCMMSKAWLEEKTLTLPIEVISKFLKEDIIKMCQPDIDTIKEKLLFLDNVDYTYKTKNIISDMKHH